VYDCSRVNAERWLRRGVSVAIVPGGAREALYSNPDIDMLDLRRKRGFVRLALRHGIPLVPTYTFNEVDVFSQIECTAIKDGSWLQFTRQNFQQTFGISMPLFSKLPHIFPQVKATIHIDFVSQSVKFHS
jgi:hypothetical protein